MWLSKKRRRFKYKLNPMNNNKPKKIHCSICKGTFYSKGLINCPKCSLGNSFSTEEWKATPQEPEQKCCDKCIGITPYKSSREGLIIKSMEVVCLRKNCPCHSPKEAPKEEIRCVNPDCDINHYKQEEVTIWDGHKFASGKDFKEALERLNSEQEEVKECRENPGKPCGYTCTCPVTLNPEKSWEERFDNMFDLDNYGESHIVQNKVKQFIRTELASQREDLSNCDRVTELVIEGAKELTEKQLLAEIREKMPKKISKKLEAKFENPKMIRTEREEGYNQALEDLTNLLDKI